MRLPFLLVPVAGFLVALVAAAVLLVALPGPGGRSGTGLGDAEEVVVAAVVQAGPEGEAGLVLLRAIEGEALVPVPVSPAQGARIQHGGSIHGESSLLEEAVVALGGRIQAALLDGDGDDLTARLLVDHRGEQVELPASAAEAVAAAVETGRPIFTTRRALEGSAMSGEDLARIHEGLLGEGERSPSISM